MIIINEQTSSYLLSINNEKVAYWNPVCNAWILFNEFENLQIEYRGFPKAWKASDPYIILETIKNNDAFSCFESKMSHPEDLCPDRFDGYDTEAYSYAESLYDLLSSIKQELEKSNINS